MTDQHPITPSTELVQKWINEENGLFAEHLATQAARWGADQELEACCKHIKRWFANPQCRIAELRATRRPKPPSLKEQALDSWDRLRNEAWCEEIDFDLDFIRRALEQLND